MSDLVPHRRTTSRPETFRVPAAIGAPCSFDRASMTNARSDQGDPVVAWDRNQLPPGILPLINNPTIGGLSEGRMLPAPT